MYRRSWYSDSCWHYFRAYLDFGVWALGFKADVDFAYKELNFEIYLGPFKAYLGLGDFR